MRLSVLLLSFILALTSNVLDAQDINPYWVRAVDWSSDGTMIAYATLGGTISILNSQTGEVILVMEEASFAFDLAWSPDNTQLAISRGYGQDPRTDILEVSSGQIIRTLPGYALSLAWSPDGRLLATANDTYPPMVKIWNVEAEEILFSPDVGEANSVAWSPDGAVLAIGRINEIRLWDVASQQYKKIFDVQGYAIALDWSPDGTQIASGDSYTAESSAVHIWDAASGQLLKAFEDPTNTVTSVAWNPSGSMVAASSIDQTVRVWDANSGELLELYQSSDSISDVSFSPFGGRLAFGEAVKSIFPTNFFNASLLRIVVPAPSLSLLNSIATTCAPDANLPTMDDLAAYIDAINTDASIPPACAADLIAVAEALQAKEITSP